MLNLFLTALPLLGNYLFSQKNKKQSQQTIQTNQKRYEQKSRCFWVKSNG